jgi:hypothetical protein
VRAFLPLVAESTTARAEGWRTQIDALKAGEYREGTWEGGEEND